jgi:cytochrome P450
VVCLDPYSQKVYLVSHPRYIKHVLQDNYRNYRQGADTFKVLIGEGLVGSDGPLWLRQRRLMQPAFHYQRIAALVPIMTQVIEAVLERWRIATEPGESLDIATEMMNLTLAIVTKTLFSTDIGDKINVVAHTLKVAQDCLHEHSWDDYKDEAEGSSILQDPDFQEALSTLDQIVYDIINKRRQSGQVYNDLLSMLLEARDEETNEGMDEKQLRDEIVTLFGAGRDTTATALSWAWYVLAQHPEVERQLHAELATVLGGRIPTFEDLPKLSYTKQVFEEVLRLYPPIWMTTRIARGEDEIGGYYIPANSEIYLSPYVTQRHPAFWENPDDFDPERFTPERSIGRPRFAYFPFGGGPRVCIGNSFALVEAQLILAMMAQTYQLHLTQEGQVEPVALITLQPQALWMTLHPRFAPE